MLKESTGQKDFPQPPIVAFHVVLGIYRAYTKNGAVSKAD
jgi:hypothetical protein